MNVNELMKQVPQMNIYDPQSYQDLASAAGVSGIKGMALKKMMRDSGFNDILGVAQSLRNPSPVKTANVDPRYIAINQLIDAISRGLGPTRMFADDIAFYTANPEAIPGYREYHEKKGSDKEIVMKGIKDNPYPSDKKFHNFAESKGKDPDEMEGAAYSLLSDFLAQGKRVKESPDKKLPESQIQKGIKVEKEHTNNPAIARRIAQDHLVEFDDYYDRLGKMEDQAKKDLKKTAGGPGSGSGKLTKDIVKHHKGLALSPKISIGKRKKFMESKKSPAFKAQKIPVSKIRYVAQERFLPEKVSRIAKMPDVADLPIDVLKDSEGLYHVMDGHHRFLGALKKGVDSLKANVWLD